MVRGTATTFPDGVTGHSQGHNWFFRHSTRACDVSYNGIRRNEEDMNTVRIAIIDDDADERKTLQASFERLAQGRRIRNRHH